MFRPSKQLQAWTLLVQDGSLDSLSGAEKIEDAISAELRDAWAAGLLGPIKHPEKSDVNDQTAWQNEKPLNANTPPELKKQGKKQDPPLLSSAHESIIPAPEVLALAEKAVKHRVSVLAPEPEKEDQDLGKPITPYYKGVPVMVDAQMVRERLEAMANKMGISRNRLIIEHMKFKGNGALGNILSPKFRHVETCFAQYFAEVLGKDILIP